MAKLFLLFILILVGVGVFYEYRPLPLGMSLAYPPHTVSNQSVQFLFDETIETNGTTSQALVTDEILSIIDGAVKYIHVDIHFFNQYQQADNTDTFDESFSIKLGEALIAKKLANEDISITIVTDSLNNVYTVGSSTNFKKFTDVDIVIIDTDLAKFRDSNRIYSPIWRTVLQWGNNVSRKFALPNPLESSGEKIAASSYFNLLNHKANHRKLIVADYPTEKGTIMISLVTSVNSYDTRQSYGNVALIVDNAIWKDVIESESALPMQTKDEIVVFTKPTLEGEGDVTVQLLTEGAIKEKLIELIEETTSDDSVDMAQLYLSETDVIDALIRASHRGVSLRLILDSNTNSSFGKKMNGFPNQMTAEDIMNRAEDNTEIKWCVIEGRSCHTNIVLVTHGADKHLLVGSANITRRSISDYNLDTNILVSGDAETTAIADAIRYFDILWSGGDEVIKTQPIDDYISESGWLKKMYHTVTELTGITSY